MEMMPQNLLFFQLMAMVMQQLILLLQLNADLKLRNTQGIHLSNLIFTGPGNGTQKDIDGIQFFTTNATGYLSIYRFKKC
jgi:hypothetical protein